MIGLPRAWKDVRLRGDDECGLENPGIFKGVRGFRSLRSQTSNWALCSTRKEAWEGVFAFHRFIHEFLSTPCPGLG